MPRSALPAETAERLVYAVQKRPVLYDVTQEDYKNRNVTECAWRDVSNEIGIDVSLCRSSWSQLKCSFLRILGKMKLPSGSGAEKKVKWYLFDHMLFLKEFVGHGKMTSNLSLPPLHVEPTAQPTTQWTAELELECHGAESLPSLTMSGSSSPVNMYLSGSEAQQAGSTESLTLPGSSESLTLPGSSESLTLPGSSGSGTAAWVETIEIGAPPQPPTSTPAKKGKKKKAIKIQEDPVQLSFMELLDKKKSEMGEKPISLLQGLEPLVGQLTYRNKISFYRETTNLLFNLLEKQSPEDSN